MSGVLHPVGPEPEETYWLRRAIVLGAFLLLVILVVALWVNSAGTGAAAGPPTSAVPAAETASASPTAPLDPSPSASATRTTGTSDRATAGEDASATTKAGGGKAGTGASAKSSTKSSAKAPAKPSGKASTKPSAKPSTKPGAKAAPEAPAACAPGDLRATLSGDRRLEPEHSDRFRVSLVNGSGSSCVVRVDRHRFALTIFSGSDRIWTSDHCAKAVPSVSREVDAGEAVAWSMTWDGRRSEEGCRTRPEVPRPGTYEATATLDGAAPVRMRMVLHD